jgi:hypothetical protein
VELLQEIGSYAGLAAIPGLAILSALYFSQARDVRRLRDWAGRAPERTAEQIQGGRVAPRPAAQPAAKPVAQPAAKPVAQPAARTAAAAGGAAAAAASGGGAATATPPRPGAATPAAAAAGNAKPATTGPPRIPPRVPSASQTSVLGVGAADHPDPWYRRMLDRLPQARYIAILLVGIAVVGGGIAFGITQLGDDGSPAAEKQSSSSAGSSGAGKGDGKTSNAKPAPLKPEDVTVSVLNGTTATGLANTTGSNLESKGFEVLNRLNGEQGAVAESVIEFAPGKEREARLVSNELDISQIEPASDANLALAGPDAEVVVILGADVAEQAAP